MPRRVVKERERDEEQIGDVINKMVTYEDNSRVNNAHFEWKYDWFEFLRFPKPRKIYELTVIDDFEFTTKKTSFFRKTRRGEGEESSEDELSEDEETERNSMKSNNPSINHDELEEDGWRMFDCYYHCQKQLFMSRIYILILQFIGANVFGDMFHTDAFRGTDATFSKTSKLHEGSAGEWFINTAFAGLRRWDAQYFLFIVDNDYLLEKCLAFFPGFVMVIRIFRMAGDLWLKGLFGISLDPYVVTGFLAVGFNMLFFYLTGLVLFILTYQICRSVKIGMLAVSIFAYNPASIFFSAAYSESLYSLTTFAPLLFILLAVRLDNVLARSFGVLMSVVFFAGGVLIRTNGLLNIFFSLWYMFGAICWETEEEPFDNSERRKFQDKLMTIRNRRHREEYQKELNELDFRKYIARKEFRFNMKGRWNFVSALILIAFTAIIIITLIPPFILYGQGIVPEFCRNNSKLAVVSRKWTTMMKIADEVRPGDLDKLEWCKKPYSYGLWPTFYSNIQHKYWDVGLFRYWQIRKIPCFLLATPALILTAIAIRITYRDIFEERKWFNIWVLFGRSDHLVPYAIHAAFLMFLGCFVINAEVFTRIIFSSTPFLYVFLAEWIDELTKGNTFANTMLDYEEANPFIPFFFIKRVWDSGIWAKLFYLYFVSYFVFGTIAHAAWLPFT